MRFSWTGLILAPLLVPTIFSGAMLSFQESNGAAEIAVKKADQGQQP